MTRFLLVGAGGALGAMARYGLGLAAARLAPGAAWPIPLFRELMGHIHTPTPAEQSFRARKKSPQKQFEEIQSGSLLIEMCNGLPKMQLMKRLHPHVPNPEQLL